MAPQWSHLPSNMIIKTKKWLFQKVLLNSHLGSAQWIDLKLEIY